MKWLLLPCTGDVFGDRAVELSGIVVDPELQAKGLGLEMVRSYLQPYHDATFLMAYSRNPAIHRLFEQYHHAPYPHQNSNPKLVEAVAEMPNASIVDGVAYHLNRYGENGLYGVNDPADRIDRTTGLKFKERYPGLQHKGTALVLGTYVYDYIHGLSSCFYPPAPGFEIISNGGQNRTFNPERDRRMME